MRRMLRDTGARVCVIWFYIYICSCFLDPKTSLDFIELIRNILNSLRVVLLLLHGGTAEDNCEDDAECADNNIAHGKEVVLATEGVGGRQYEALVSIEAVDVVVVVDHHLVGAHLQVLFDLSVELAEVRQTRRSHPHDEVL